MAECSKCKYAVWDCVEYGHAWRKYYVEDCELDNDPEDCEAFEEYMEDEG